MAQLYIKEKAAFQSLSRANAFGFFYVQQA